jgi:hypothetical protein
MIHEINNPDWPAFCERVTRQLAGALAKLEIIGPDGAVAEEVPDATFQNMTLDKSGACSDVIRLRLTAPREIVRDIIEPIRVTLRASNGSGDFNPLRIESEIGSFQITFHPAIHAQLLVGLKTA